MAKPRVFISSTFYDLKQVRSSLETFVRDLGFDPVLSEKVVLHIRLMFRWTNRAFAKRNRPIFSF